VFIYLSDPFFRFLTGRSIAWKMTRRMRALGDLQLVRRPNGPPRWKASRRRRRPSWPVTGFCLRHCWIAATEAVPCLSGWPAIDSLRGAGRHLRARADIPSVDHGCRSCPRTAVRGTNYRNHGSAWTRVTVGIARRVETDRKRERVLIRRANRGLCTEHYQSDLPACSGSPIGDGATFPAGDLLAIDMR